MNILDILFMLGSLLLTLFFVALLLRAVVVQIRGRQLIHRGIMPKQVSQTTPEAPFSSGGMYRASGLELAVLALLFVTLLVEGALTEGVVGIVKAIVAIVIILGLGPAIAAWFWYSIDSKDGLAKLCHRLLSWAVTCFTLPLLSLLG